MADTQRTLAAVLALLADNTSGAISPQDLRDALVSVFSNYGTIGLAGGSTAQTGISATPAKVTGFATDGEAGGCVEADAANNRLKVTVDGMYLLLCGCSFSGANSKTYLGEIYAGGAAASFKKLRRKLGTGGDVGDAFAFAFASMSANDYVEFYISSTDGGSTFTPEEMGLLALKIG